MKPSSLTAVMLLAVCCGLTDWLLENLHSARAGGGLRFFFWCWYNNVLDPRSKFLHTVAPAVSSVEAHLEMPLPQEKPGP